MTIALSGVVPDASTAPTRNGARRSVRAVLPNSASFRITVEGDDFSRTSEQDASGSALSISGLPVGDAISITVESLDGNGDAITSWNGTRTLKKGDNELSVALAPVSTVTEINVADDNATSIAAPTIAAGGYAFYRLNFHSTLSGERQILFDTGKARWVWMGVYDDQWNPLVPAAGDQSQGWVVLDVDANRTVNVAVANVVSSPGYPAGSIACTLQARPAVFFAPGATGTGTSTAPADFSAYSFGGASYASFFLRAGSYLRGGGMDVMSASDQRYYGGFSASSWNARSGETSIGSGSSWPITLTLYDGTTGCLDGLSLNAPVVADENSQVFGLYLSATTTGTFVINDCAISGSPSGSGTVGLVSCGVYASGNIEISSSTIDGGSITASTGTPSTYGLMVNDTPSAYFHNSILSGGIATCTVGADINVATYAVSGGSGAGTSLVIADCVVWGGVASSGGTNSSTYSSGLRWLAPDLIVANSLVSGGYSNSSGGGARTDAIYHYYPGTSSILLAGNTIDAGYANAETKYSFGAYYDAAGGGRATNNAFFITNYQNSVTETAVVVNASGGLLSSLDYNAAFNSTGSGTYTDPYYSTTDDFSSAGVIDYMNDADWQRTPGEELVSYSAPTSLATFLAQDWRPRSVSLFAGISGTASPFTAAQLASYPALAYDLAGVARPAVWARGAYER